MGSLISSFTTSYMSSIETIALSCLVIEKISPPSATWCGTWWANTCIGTRAITYSARPTERCLALYMTANRMDDNKVRCYAEDNRKSRIVRTGKYEAKVTNNIEKNCARGILLLKRSSGPLATAELYLFSSPLRNRRFSDIC